MSTFQKKRRAAYNKGKRGECIAAFFLKMKGYDILQRRCKTPFGEIDILAHKKGVLVAVEVKNCGRSIFKDAVTAHQKLRVRRALRLVAKRFPHMMHQRCDVIFVVGGCWPRHVQQAF